jgi:hypothetical protein
VSARRLAAALAARLGLVSLPGRITEEWLAEVIAPFAGDLELGAREALVAVQEQMIEATDLPWPETYADWSSVPPVAGARVEGDVLRLWYGDASRPVLELEPVSLDELS